MLIGAPLALAADRLGRAWLFYVGLALLIIGLMVPARPGQSLSQRVRGLASHLPLLRWLGRRERGRRGDRHPR